MGECPPTYQALADLRLRDWLCAMAEGAEIIGSVSTGALILAAAGLLHGRQATTRWAHSKILEKLGATNVRKRWVEDGKYITSAGRYVVVEGSGHDIPSSRPDLGGQRNPGSRRSRMPARGWKSGKQGNLR